MSIASSLIFPLVVAAVLIAQLIELVLKILNLHALERWYRRKSPIGETGEDKQAAEQQAAEQQAERSYQYQKSLQHLALLGSVFNGGIFLLFLALRLPAWLFDQLGAMLAGSPLWHGAAFVAVLQGAQFLLELPWGLYRRFVVEERFGFNQMAPKDLVRDLLRGFLLAILLGLPLLLGLFWLMRALPLWWLWGFLALTGYQLLLLWLYPVLIAPLFNRFTPLGQVPEGGPDELQRKQVALKERLEHLLKQCGFAAKGLFVMDGSKRSRHSNAYFTGFGRYRRIVLFDTLIQDLEQEQLAAVLAHEIGHYRKGHIPKRMLQSMLWLLLGFLGLYLLSRWQELFLGFGFAHLPGKPPHPAVLLFVGVVLSSLPGLLLRRLGNHFSRKHEFEADAYAAQVMGSGRCLREALELLHRENLSNPAPHPGYAAQYYSHPALPERLAVLEVP